ncbi:ParB/RepB/Spo0J family partition protein [Alcaligenes aquatilis]|uniref:ParB/RepB/Spo0J family partition protein n=1 Tax=Alcaligenes aquatilis TaxID=323284 RepID=UPI003F8FF2A0
MSETTYPMIQLARIQPSRTNPRKTFKETSLLELQESITKHGVLQPILLRKLPLLDGDENDPWYEIIAGERRYRASIGAGLTEIPARTVVVDDLEMFEMQIIENLQREDLHPLEEAESYEALMAQHKDDPNYSVDQVAAKLGKSRAYIYARLKLCALQPASRTAFYEDKINPSVALLLARIPVPDLQDQALKEVTEGKWGGGPMSYRDAARHIQDTYMTRLDQAPFKASDTALYPAAGACTACPKRTGANPDLFSDVGRADVCTDPSCYGQKITLHRERIRSAAAESGKKIITGKEAKKIRPYQHGDMKGYLKPDESPWWMESDKSIKKTLGKDMPETILIECPHKGDLIEIVPEDEVRTALKQNGIKVSRAASESSASERERMKKAKAEREYRRQLLTEIQHAARNHLGNGGILSLSEMRLIAQKMYRDLAHDFRPATAAFWEWQHKELDSAAEQIDSMEPGELALLMLSCALAPHTYVSHWNIEGCGRPTELLNACERYGVDAEAIKCEHEAVPAKKAALKNAAKTKYLDPTTGSSWSGRGKPPQWIVSAEAAGRSRDEFLNPEYQGLAQAHAPESAPMALLNEVKVNE